MKIKWYGTACLLLENEEEDAQTNQRAQLLLIDPFFPLNKKLYKPQIDSEFSQVSSILVTHGHFDHITGIPSVIENCKRKPFIYCTQAPHDALISMGIEKDLAQKIIPGNKLILKPFEVTVLKGKHVVFDKPLLVKTLLSPRMLINIKNLKCILKENKKCREEGETVVYDIKIKDKRILLMGSLNLDDAVDYPEGADLLFLPLQGRSDICKYAMKFIDRLKPAKVFVTHYDNSFPPISSHTNIKLFESLMRKNFPNIPVIIPQAGQELIDVI